MKLLLQLHVVHWDTDSVFGCWGHSDEKHTFYFHLSEFVDTLDHIIAFNLKLQFYSSAFQFCGRLMPLRFKFWRTVLHTVFHNIHVICYFVTELLLFNISKLKKIEIMNNRRYIYIYFLKNNLKYHLFLKKINKYLLHCNVAEHFDENMKSNCCFV